ncbi:MAG: HesA/MoeB/ThiF family protein [Chloroflexia bacterium]
MEGWLQALRRKARLLPGPGGENVPTLPPEVLAEAARRAGRPLREIELQALDAGLLPERYLRNLGLFGREGQRRLLERCVAVVGCGGLGGHVIEGLARSGVGRLIVIDGDRFVPHNLNRQILGTLDTLGRPKAEVAAERVVRVNPAVEVVVWTVAATEENLPDLLAGADVVVDALDTPRDRLRLQAAAARLGLPLVHGAIAGFIGQVTTVFPGDEALSLLYGRERVPDHGAEFFLGTPAPTPALVAAFQVAEVLKLLLGRGELLHRRLLYIDLEAGTVETFPLGEAGIGTGSDHPSASSGDSGRP